MNEKNMGSPEVTTDCLHLLCNVVLYSQVVLHLERIGEDETSYQEHIHSINREMGKKLMKDSFPENRGNEQANRWSGFHFLGVPQLVSTFHLRLTTHT